MIYNSPVLPFLAARASHEDAFMRLACVGPIMHARQPDVFRNRPSLESDSDTDRSLYYCSELRTLETQHSVESHFVRAPFHSSDQYRSVLKNSLFHISAMKQVRQPSGCATRQLSPSFDASRKGGGYL